MRTTSLMIDLLYNKKGKVKIIAEGPFGESEMVLPMTENDFELALGKWDAGELVQVAFPTLNASQREFLMTGMNPKQQKAIFG